ncbi:Beta-barrel assembly-enhancing protease [Granulosicoccus antarcticus IMCC3135]|uniref:Beta-barrel assembly-enhancing protease n=1 Tax=Granulosicoccus antarcticus IMCC3135 TaxID=1192854 RepID=A0A2Z2P2K2_9GAMM|nr:Beta-barrel assembly-enhancing protease [Granulosicoccus antarcticus IMCC3135]
MCFEDSNQQVRKESTPMQLRSLVPLVIVTSSILSACVSVQTTQPGAIGLDRTQRMSTLVSADELNQGAVTAYAQVIGEANKEGTLNTNAAMTKRVKAIANRIIPTVGVFREDAKSWDWQVNVINSDQLNAWAMPGGKIAFYSGIIEKLQLTDAEIAAIMGHEISHALREHSRERASEEANKSLVLGILSQATGAGATTQALADLVYKTTLGLPNSRLHETESDRMGVELMARAGYDPRAAIAVWEKMAKLTGGSSSPEFLSTHPSNDTRIKDLTNYAAKVMPLYEAAKKS